MHRFSSLLPRGVAAAVALRSSSSALLRQVVRPASSLASSSSAGTAAPVSVTDQVCPCCYGSVHKRSISTSVPLGAPIGTGSTSHASRGGESVVSMILSEHRKAEGLFDKYHKSTDSKVKQQAAWDLIKEISQHGAKEEMSIYPWMKKNHPSTAGLIDHGLKEHQRLKEDLAALDSMKVTDPKFDQTIQRAWKDLTHHIKEEESDILPALEKKASAQELADLGKTFQDVASIAPTRPHPHAPAEGMAAVAANAGAKVVDSVRDAVRNSGKK